MLQSFMGVAKPNNGALAPPSAIVFTMTTDIGDGEVIFNVSALPATWGDLVTPGDGDGVLGILERWDEVEGWQLLVDPAATGSYPATLSALLYGQRTIVRVRGVSDAGNAGTAASREVLVPPQDADEDSIGTMEIGSTFRVR
jgi:hypothetical protein